MRWLKRIIIGTVSVVLVLVALALIVPFLIPTSTYKDQIQTRVKAATGRDLILGGELKFSILPSLELSARDVTFGNRAGAAPKDMVRLKGLDLKLKLGPLLSGRFDVDALVLQEPVIVLEVDKDGKPNWQFDKPGAAPPPATAPPKAGDTASPRAATPPSDILESLQIAEFRIVRGSVVYSDARGGARYELAKANITVSLPGGDQPLKIAGDTEYKAKRMAIRSEIKSPSALMKGQPSPFVFEFGFDLLKLALEGTLQAGPAPKVAAPLKLSVPSVRDLAAWLGNPLPQGDAFGAITLAGNVAATLDGITLADLSVQLFNGTATGQVSALKGRGGFIVAANLELKGLDGYALLVAAGATDKIAGTLNATANLTGTGAEPKAIQNSLAGTAKFQFANGALRGYNLAGLFRVIGDIKNPLEIIQQVKKAIESLNKFDDAQKTDFSELSASFRATNGVFNTSDLRMAAPLIRVEGKGTISLPASAVDMHVLVKAVPTLQGQGSDFAKLGIPIPLRVQGPFSNVAWGLDEKAFGDEIRKKAPELIKDHILKNPGDILKKPGGILDQFRR